MVSIETMGMTRMDKTVKVLRYIPIANENYGFADAETTLNFDRMWKRPSRPHISAMGICCIGSAVGPRDILLAGDARIPKF